MTKNYQMNFKETFYFVAKMFNYIFEAKNRQEIEKQLKSLSVDWDEVVKFSTGHCVFPALYCNLKRANFLIYLPVDLVDYMKNIADINRNRNNQIIQQAKELDSLLSANNIKPVFLKGTGNLLAGIYDDISERMVGDIDFIVSKDDYPKAIKLLREFGYSEVHTAKYYFPDIHYRRLEKVNNIAAIEIHKELSREIKYQNEFNYSIIVKDSQLINDIRVMSYANKLNLSIIASQINDKCFYYKTLSLRNAYDVFLLSKITNAKDAVNRFNKLANPLSCFLAASNEVFNTVDSLKYNNTKKVASYLSVFTNQFINIEKAKRRHIFIKFYLYIKSRLNTLYKLILYKI